MKIQFIDKLLGYDGSELRSHWILENTAIFGDALVTFVGPCKVTADHMVDLEDVLQHKNIYSESMLHFLVEHFDCDLEKMILRQRLLICLMQAELMDAVGGAKIVRKGDDLFLDEFKLTVSIATSSPVSSLIHAGMNISSANTPVPTKGLNDFGINPQAFATGVMNRYSEEIAAIKKARAKVKGVR